MSKEATDREIELYYEMEFKKLYDELYNGHDKYNKGSIKSKIKKLKKNFKDFKKENEYKQSFDTFQKPLDN